MNRRLSRLRLFSVLAGLLLLVIVSVAAKPASAVTQPAISVSPFLQEVKISGQEPTKNFTVTYTNDASTVQNISFSILDFGTLDQTGGVAFVGNSANYKYGLAHWLTLDQTSASLAPGQSLPLTATIINDNSLTPGGHYAAIVATRANSATSGSNPVSIQQKLSSLVFAVKTGGEYYDLKLQKITTDGNLFKLPTEVHLSILAAGNVHIEPRGVVSLNDSNAKTIARGVINEQSGYVLPGATRIFDVNLTPIASHSWWQTTFKLKVDYRYEGINSFASKQLTIRAFNSKSILALLVILIALIYIIYKFGKRILRRLWKTNNSR